jgi:hypothetical protein
MADLLMLHRPQSEPDLRVVQGSESAPRPRNGTSFVTINVDAVGHIDFESEVAPEHAERMTDVLLLTLIKAREARR